MEETLIKQVAQGTGLEPEKVKAILSEWVQETGKSPQDINLEDFREVLVEIMQKIFTEVASGENPFIQMRR